MTVIVTPAGTKVVEEKSFPLASASDPKKFGPSGGRVQLLHRELAIATYEAMYRSQPWVHVVVNKLVRGIARLPLKSYRFLDDENRKRVRDHPLPGLLRRPHPRGSAWSLKAAVVGSLAVHGNALVVKVRRGAGQPPIELWPVPWRHIEVVTDGAGGPAVEYVFHGTRDRIPYRPDDVVHFAAYGPDGAIGISPLEALRRTLALEDASQTWAGQVFVNAATPSGVFRTDGRLRDETIPRLRAELQRLYGGVENAGRFAIVDQGLDWKSAQFSAVDTALIEQRKLNREEVAAAYDIPPPLIGILDRATFSNVTELHRSLYVDTIGPKLTQIEETLEAQLVAGEPLFDGIFCEFDLSEVLKGDAEKLSQAYQRFLQSGVLTPNEMRRLENRPPIDDPAADTVYVPLNMIPVGTAPEELEMRARAAATFAPRDAPPTVGGDES